MKLPNRQWAFVETRKLDTYLLNHSHPRGRHKAYAFSRHGYSLENADELEVELLRIAHHADVAEVDIIEGAARTEYVQIEILAQSRRQFSLTNPEKFRIIWEIKDNDTRPRLITAYPQVWKG